MKKKEKLSKLNIKDVDKLPVYFQHLTEVVFSDLNIKKIIVVESKLHQTNLHEISSFYKPICKITD